MSDSMFPPRSARSLPRAASLPSAGSRARLSAVAASTLAALLAGCGGAGDPPPGWGDNLHVDLTLASTEEGGGALAVAYDFTKVVEVTFVQCFGGTGTDCTGGVKLYAAEDPGFGLLAVDDPGDSLFVLPDDVEIRIEVTAADEGASLFVSDATLEEAGDSVVLGTTPDIHAHGSWQLAIPADGPVAEDYALAIRMTTDDGFGDSAEYVVLLEPHDD